MRVNLQSAYTGNTPAEVTFEARVVSGPRFFYSSRTQREHEAFNVQTGCGPLEVVDNVDIAPRIPVQPGDRVQIRGEIVHDPNRDPIVHWTHHDPQGLHPGGFIQLQGRVYA